MSGIMLGRICRTCLQKSQDMHKINKFAKDEKIIVEEMLLKIMPKFNSFDEVTPLPVEICEICLKKLKISYNFHVQCIEINEKLKKMLALQDPIGKQLVAEEQININSSSENVLDDIKEELIVGEEQMKINNSSEKEHVSYDIKEEDTLSINDLNECLVTEQCGVEELEDEECMFTNKNEKDQLDCESSDGEWNKSMSDLSVEENQPLKSKELPLNSRTCKICNKTFSKRYVMLRHMNVHSLENKCVCEVCGYRYTNATKLQRHLASHSENRVNITLSDGPYKCKECPRIFEDPRGLACHRVKHSSKDIKCSICAANVKSIAALTRHMKTKHPDVRPYQCTMCEEAFHVEAHLELHVNKHKGIKRYNCDKCDKRFPNTTCLREHMRSHSGESPFLCSLCGKSFKTGNILRLHLVRHGEKNFQCTECPMKFYTKMNLAKHMPTHTKERKHVCETCGAAFTRQDTLKVHKAKHTGLRPFVCTECNMTFIFERNLKKHILTHSGEKPHMCTYCDQAYLASGDLVKHLRTHVGEKTYFCDECPERFKYLSELKEHKNQHYKKSLISLASDGIVEAQNKTN